MWMDLNTMIKMKEPTAELPGWGSQGGGVR